ncbi:MAG: C25 family cysteine peptidase [Desulfocapsaceae bacterium]|nr:C25 family cysteine peptidase [Desulfocapsaceae bacterium]
MLFVITPSLFAPALDSLRVHKEKHGMLTTVITLEKVYQDYSGSDEAEKVKRCIHQRVHEQGIRYVLLMGDSDVFPVRFTKTDRGDAAAKNTAFYATDLYYAAIHKSDDSFDNWDGNGNGYYGELHGETHTGPINIDQVSLDPVVGVGRAPVSTLEEAIRFVQKVINYETQAYHAGWAKNALLMATHDWITTACQINDHLAVNHLTAYNCTKLASTGSPCTGAGALTAAKVTQYFNSGIGLVGYIGHGTSGALQIPGGWWGTGDIAQLTNNNRLPIMCVSACSTAEFATLPPYGAYVDKNGVNHAGSSNGEVFTSTPPQPSCLQNIHDPDQDLATHLTVRTDAGVVAYLGGITGMQMSEPLEYFLEGLPSCSTLGEAWQAMIRRYYQVQGMPGSLASPDWFAVAKVHQPWKFMMFGDPSLRIGGTTKGLWSQQQLTRGDRGTSHGPAVASWQKKLFMTWKGKLNDEHIFQSTFADNVWSPQQLTSGDRGTSDGPALAVFKDKLHMVWKGKFDDVRIFHSVFDGAAWTSQVLTSGDRGTSAAPTLAVFKNKLHMVWKGKFDDVRIFHSVYDGVSWTPQKLTSGDRGTSTAPALAVYSNKLHMVWKGLGNDVRIFHSTYDGTAWTPQQLTSVDRGTSHSPALAAYRGKLHMVWKGKYNDVRIFSSAFDGSSWSPQKLTSGDRGTSDGPALVVHDDKLFLVWKGKGTDPRIFFSYLYTD